MRGATRRAMRARAALLMRAFGAAAPADAPLLAAALRQVARSSVSSSPREARLARALVVVIIGFSFRSRAISMRPLALRPRLATGVPLWWITCDERWAFPVAARIGACRCRCKPLGSLRLRRCYRRRATGPNAAAPRLDVCPARKRRKRPKRAVSSGPLHRPRWTDRGGVISSRHHESTIGALR